MIKNKLKNLAVVLLSLFVGRRALCVVYGHHLISIPDSQIKNLWLVGCDFCGEEIAKKWRWNM